MQTPTDLDPPEGVRRRTLGFAIPDWFMENEITVGF